MASHPGYLAPTPEIRAPAVWGPRARPAASSPPAHPARKSSAIARFPARPPFFHVLLLLRPFAGLVAVGGTTGLLGWNSAGPPPPGAELRADRGLGAAAAQRATPRPAYMPRPPARWPLPLSAGCPGSLTSGRRPRPSTAATWAGAESSQWTGEVRTTPRGLRAAAASHWLSVPG